VNEQKKKYTHPMRFVCSLCATVHEPTCSEWLGASKELWAQGWTICQRKNETTGLWGTDYHLTCPKCIPIEVKNAGAFVQG
jgi:hypothetical protein